jgi:RHS repeat-associated protein
VYALTDLAGTVTRFDILTGRWTSATDRWQNAITANYTGMPTSFSVSDSQGRTLTFTLTGGLITQVQDSDGNTWKFTYTSGYLTQIQDPFHLASGFWRSYQYASIPSVTPNPLSSVTDEQSKVLEGFTYDSIGRVITTFAEGNQNFGTIEYDTPVVGQTRVKTRIDNTPTDQVSVFDIIYQGGRYLATRINGNCSSCSGADGDDQTFTYDSGNHVLVRKVGVAAQGEQVETDFTYDANGMVLTRAEAGIRTTTYAYAQGTPAGFLKPWPSFMTSVTENSVVKVSPQLAKATVYSWSSTGTCIGAGNETCLQTTVTGYLNTGDPGTSYQTSARFDSKHRQAEVDGPELVGGASANRKTTFSYFDDGDAALDRRGRLKTTSLFTTVLTSLDMQYDNYDVFGTAKKVTDPNGVETDRTTDGKGRVTNVTELLVASDSSEWTSYTTNYTLDLRDRLTDVVRPLGNKLHYVYEDGTNRLTDTIRVDSSGNQQERLHLTLNVIGGKTREDSQSCGQPAATCQNWTTKRFDSFSYNTHNRLTSVTHYDGTHIDYVYDTRGNLLTTKDENHTSANTTNVYDALSRVTSVRQTLSGAPGGQITTSYTYDTQDNLTAVTDPNGNQTTYAYDDFRRMQTQVSPVTLTTKYSYDAAGDLTKSVDARQGVNPTTDGTTRTYDAANRALSSTAVLTGAPTEITTWTYDDPIAGKYGKGRLTFMADPSGSTSYAYERRGLVKTEARTIWGNQYTMTYGYDANGNRKVIQYPGNVSALYNFDFADRPNSVDGGILHYATAAKYEPFGPVTQVDFGNSTRKTISHDQRYLPSDNKLTQINLQTTYAEYSYGKDATGNITSISDLVDSTYSRSLFGYDDLNRLTTANTAGSLWGAGSYQYDSMGNITSLGLGSRTATFSYSGTTPKLTSVTESGPRSVTYDASGNETAVGSSNFFYSARNLLTSGDGLYYVYDGRGVRTVTLKNDPTSLPVASVSPSHGSHLGGTSITIIGTGFVSGATVTIGGVAATNVNVLSSGQEITAATPALSAATLQDVVVANPGSGSGTLTGGFFVDFLDVASDDPFQPYVEKIFRAGITTGCGSGNYCPNDNVSRAQMAMFIARAQAGSDANVPVSGMVGGSPYNCSPGGTSLFNDVFTTDIYCKHVHYIYGTGVTTGCVAGVSYCPSGTVPRSSMAMFIARAMAGGDAAVPLTYGPDFTTGRSYSCDPSTPSLHFTDISVNDIFCKHTHYLWARGTIDGCNPPDNTQYCPTPTVGRLTMAKFLSNAFQLAGIPSSNRRYFFYTPEMNLIAESELTSSAKPAILYNYIWLGGEPVAQVDGSLTTHWTFTDHLGTPLIQTDINDNIYWRAEYEPYGRVSLLRTGDQHQPLRLPGQEAEQFNLGQNGATERSYNVFRWYRPNWGRYTQSDPFLTEADADWMWRETRLEDGGLANRIGWYSYTDDDPLLFVDPTGLVKYKPGIPPAQGKLASLLGCIESCVGQELFVTSTREPIPQHPPGTPHRRGEAADLGSPSQNSGSVLCCAKGCGAGFALDEAKHPSKRSTGPHFHVQLGPGTKGGQGDLPSQGCPCK